MTERWFSSGFILEAYNRSVGEQLDVNNSKQLFDREFNILVEHEFNTNRDNEFYERKSANIFTRFAFTKTYNWNQKLLNLSIEYFREVWSNEVDAERKDIAKTWYQTRLFVTQKYLFFNIMRTIKKANNLSIFHYPQEYIPKINETDPPLNYSITLWELPPQGDVDFNTVDANLFFFHILKRINIYRNDLERIQNSGIPRRNIFKRICHRLYSTFTVVSLVGGINVFSLLSYFQKEASHFELNVFNECVSKGLIEVNLKGKVFNETIFKVLQDCTSASVVNKSNDTFLTIASNHSSKILPSSYTYYLILVITIIVLLC